MPKIMPAYCESLAIVDRVSKAMGMELGLSKYAVGTFLFPKGANLSLPKKRTPQAVSKINPKHA